jgi:hypothetical protein
MLPLPITPLPSQQQQQEVTEVYHWPDSSSAESTGDSTVPSPYCVSGTLAQTETPAQKESANNKPANKTTGNTSVTPTSVGKLKPLPLVPPLV